MMFFPSPRPGTPADFYENRNKNAHQDNCGQHKGKSFTEVRHDELFEGKFHSAEYNELQEVCLHLAFTFYFNFNAFAVGK